MNKIIPMSILGIFILSGVGTVAGVFIKNPLDGPYGPTEGYVGVEYTFLFKLPVNPNDYEYYAKWDWGDGNISEWLGPYPSGQIINASHTWWTLGSYEIRVKLKDMNGTEYLSDPLIITIIDYRPPNPPNITGPHFGKTNINYTFSIGNFTNPDEDPFYSLWYWDDGSSNQWVGPFNFNASHAWNKPGNYTIRVRIKDVWGAWSNWSAPFFITIVKLKSAFFLGSFDSLNQTDDLLIMKGQTFIVFPSHLIFYKGETIVISKNYLGHLGTSFILGVGGAAILQ
jgi:hypothetical protein